MCAMENKNNEFQEREKNSGFSKILKRFVVVVIVLILFILSGAFVIGAFYGNEVKSYIISQLNKQLNTQVVINPDNISFSILKNFPSASVDFKHVLALDAVSGKNKKDTLFSAGVISLQFNMLDIFNKNYHIRKIHLYDAVVKIKIYQNGTDNYHFWKSSSDNSSESFSFALEKIRLKNVVFSYSDAQANQFHSVRIEKGLLSGKFTNELYNLDSDLQLYVQRLSSDSVTYLNNKNVSLNADLLINNNSNTYTVQSGKIKIANLAFGISGTMNYRDSITSLDIKMKAAELTIQSVLSLLPEKYKNKIAGYTSEGNFYIDAIVKGKYARTKSPLVFLKFGIENGDIKDNSNGLELNNVQLKGEFSTQNNSKLTVSEFSGKLKEGKLNGHFTIEDFSKPMLNLSLNANMNLENFQKLAKIDTIKSINGRGIINLNYNGRMPQAKNGKSFVEQYMKNANVSGNLQLTEMNLRLKNSKQTFDSINGSFVFDNNDLIVDEFKGKVSGSDFLLKGFLKNSLPWLFLENENLNIEASLKCNKLNLDELLVDDDKPTLHDTIYEVKFPEYLRFDLNIFVDRLHFRRFNAANIEGRILLKEKRMLIDPVSFNTMDGKVSGAAVIDGSKEGKLFISCSASLNKVNITKLFTELENFGQKTFTDKNIRGFLTSDIRYSSEWSSRLESNLDKVYATADVKIEKGELRNFEPLKQFSKFINVNDLENIKFSTLENQIEIKDQTIFIPKMNLKNNALNLVCSGKHKFNNEIDYHIQLLMHELLAKKANKAKRENEEFGEVESDGSSRSLFISMTGTVDNPVIKYDRKGMFVKVKEDIKKEKENLKGILHDEFGWFKKDSAFIKKEIKEEKKKDQKFIIKWDEKNEEKKKEEEDF